jgi:hypothetical protein
MPSFVIYSVTPSWRNSTCYQKRKIDVRSLVTMLGRPFWGSKKLPETHNAITIFFCIAFVGLSAVASKKKELKRPNMLFVATHSL